MSFKPLSLFAELAFYVVVLVAIFPNSDDAVITTVHILNAILFFLIVASLIRAVGNWWRKNG